jgi:hypothetical protein
MDVPCCPSGPASDVPTRICLKRMVAIGPMIFSAGALPETSGPLDFAQRPLPPYARQCNVHNKEGKLPFSRREGPCLGKWHTTR